LLSEEALMLLGGLGWGEIVVVLLIALVVVGPERLPGVAEQAGKNLRKLRVWLKAMTDDVKAELGPEVGDLDLRSLHPRWLVSFAAWRSASFLIVSGECL